MVWTLKLALLVSIPGVFYLVSSYLCCLCFLFSCGELQFCAIQKWVLYDKASSLLLLTHKLDHHPLCLELTHIGSETSIPSRRLNRAPQFHSSYFVLQSRTGWVSNSQHHLFDLVTDHKLVFSTKTDD